MEFNKLYPILIVVGMILAVVAINQSYIAQPPIYKVGCCTFNGNLSCGEECTWNGECTDEIEDECCMPIRMCGGETTTPEDCYTKYCSSAGQRCVPVYQVAGVYECQCKDAYEPYFPV